MARDREVEWQLDAVDLRPVARLLAERPRGSVALEPTGAVSIRDRYLDTQDWRLHRARSTLRIRTVGRRSEATLKSKGTLVDGLRDRRELTEPLSPADPEAVRALPGEVGRSVRALAGRRRLRQLFEIRNRRQTFAVTVDGDRVGELSLDDTTIPVTRGRPARLQRVEIEVEPGAVDAVSPFVDELRSSAGLRPATASKFQAGLLAAGLVPPARDDLGPTAVDEQMTVGELAFGVLRRQFATFLEREPAARLGEDSEGVHDMRVATRRMRAAMSLFREALPVRTQRLRDELKWVAGVLGEVRDLDVQLGQLGEWERDMSDEDVAALRPLVESLEHRHAEARAMMLEALDSRRYERTVTGMTELLKRGPLRRSQASRMPALVAAPDLVRRRYRPVRKRGDAIQPTSPPEDFHALRIRCKRLRYAVEFLSPLAPKQSERLIAALVEVQDCLGEHQDAQVAMARLREMAEDGLPPRAVFLLGRIDERYERRAAELRAEFPDAYAGIRGKAWKGLRHVLDERRDRAVADSPPRAPSLRPAPAPRRTARTPPTTPPARAARHARAAAPPPGLAVVRD
jgi:CHAD domain-containing protein